MKVLMTAAEAIADPEAWLDLRREYLTASDMAALAGVEGAWTTPTGVYWGKVAGDRKPRTVPMLIGLACEPTIAQLWEEDRPSMRLERGPFARDPDVGWLACTYDYLAYDRVPGAAMAGVPRMPVELKTSNTRAGYGDPPYGEVPDRYVTQALVQMHVGGFDELELAVYFFGTDSPPHIYTLRWDADAEADFAWLVDAGQKFLDRHIGPRRAPPVDWRPATTATLKRVWRPPACVDQVQMPARLRDRFYAAKAAVKKAEARAGQAENEIRDRLGRATHAVGPDGEVFAARSIYPNRRVSVRRVRDEYPEIAAECTVTGDPVDKLLAKHPKKPRD